MSSSGVVGCWDAELRGGAERGLANFEGERCDIRMYLCLCMSLYLKRYTLCTCRSGGGGEVTSQKTFHISRYAHTHCS